ncbi:translation initiation factor IF3-1, mitochondrial [Euphorbia lathyris]|uniref:translation initiation factor IF3-1, mitochondrial n=1 Tax=Euphorbia lathyris TaxID=212925 RepID=UPI003313EBBF
MALWHRINQSKLKFLSHQLSRCYVQTPHASLSNYIVRNPICAIASPIRDFSRRSTDLFNNVRFFATSFQAKAKKDEKANGGKLLNDEIKAQTVRLVTEEGHFVISLREARERARRLNLDLVQVQGSVDPPVCKIMDFKREQYKRKMQEKDRAKEKKEVTLKKGSCKEVRFLEKTELKDLKMKADSVVRLMERGYRVKCMAVGSPKKGGRAASWKSSGGEELTEQEIAEIRRQEEEEEKERLKEVLSRLTALIGDEYILESGPRAEKKQAFVVVRHAKFGPKKGGAKKMKVAGKVSTSHSGPIGSSDMVEEDSVESGAETEDESLTNEDSENAWSVADSVDDFDTVFDVKGDGKEPSLNYTQNIPVSPEVGVPSSPHQSFEAENRYKRSELRERYPPTPPRDNRAPDRTDSSRITPPQFSNQRGREQFPPTPSRDNSVPDRTNSFRITPPQFSNQIGREQFPPTLSRDNSAPNRTESVRITPPQFSNQSGRERPPTPPRENRAPYRIDSFRITPPQFATGKTQLGINPSTAMGERKPVQTDSSTFRNNLPNPPNAQPSSYGIFSNMKSSTLGKQGVASQVNNNTEEKPNNLGGNSNTGGFGGSQGPRDDGREQPKWGVFSKDGPSVNPNRISK